MEGRLQEFEPAGFIRDYLAYARRLTDAPEPFHVFTALTVLGAAASRVRVTFGPLRVQPSLWTVLVAPSAFYRKTTAMEIGRRILAAARPELPAPAAYRAEDAVAELRDGERLVCVDDFTDLLLVEARERLVRLGDTGAPLSLLAAGGTSVLAWRLSAADLAGGFLARFALVVSEKKTGWHALPGAADAAAERALAGQLARVARLEGDVSFAASLGQLSQWGHNAMRWINSAPAGGHWETAAGLVSRLELTLLKLAALVELSTTGSLEVSPESFRAARVLERFLRSSFGRLLAQELRRGNQFQDELKVLALVRRAPGITRRRLQQNIHLRAATLRRAIGSLLSSGRIHRNGHQLYPNPLLASRPVLAENPANGNPVELVEVNP